MTALETLLACIPNISSLTTELYTTTTSWQDASDEGKTTTVCLAASTILNNIEVPDEIIIVRDTYAYVESMSDEELARASELIEAKSLEIEKIEQESTKTVEKVFVKSTKQQ